MLIPVALAVAAGETEPEGVLDAKRDSKGDHVEVAVVDWERVATNVPVVRGVVAAEREAVGVRTAVLLDDGEAPAVSEAVLEEVKEGLDVGVTLNDGELEGVLVGVGIAVGVSAAVAV